MEITFLNHASFIFRYDNFKILVDPYLKGNAFNNAWSLLSEQEHDLSNINYIFFSHEHPDHFSVDFIKNNFKENRSEITILYQETYDKRVINFCNKLGYKTLELPNKKMISLEQNIEIICGKVPFYDSWLYIKTPEKNILNVNDCVLEDPSILGDIKKYVSNCDVLFTQFSYADFDDEENRILKAKEQLNRIVLQDKELNPKYIIPFASFIYFSNEDNFYMNDHINFPDKTNDFLQAECQANIIWFKPNDKWDCNSKKNNLDAINYWMNIYDNLNQLKKISVNNVSTAKELSKKSKIYKERILKNNNKLLIFLYQKFTSKPIYFYIKDIKQYAKYSFFSGFDFSVSETNSQITINSDVLAFVFDYDYGIDTFSVGARFNSNKKDYENMIRSLIIGELNNTGRYLKFSEIYKFINRDLIKRISSFILQR